MPPSGAKVMVVGINITANDEATIGDNGRVVSVEGLGDDVLAGFTDDWAFIFFCT